MICFKCAEKIISTQQVHPGPQADFKDLLLAHDLRYITGIQDGTLPAQELRPIGLPWSPGMFQRSLCSVGGFIAATENAISDGFSALLAGGTHHAGSNWAEGFCLLNDQAIAANYLLAKGLSNRILIIDLDVHQGNGTAEIFRNEKRVFTFSMHAEKNFPFRKEQSNLDIGLPDGVSDIEYLTILSSHLTMLFAEHEFDFVFYLAGVDILVTDRLGKLNVSTKACKERDEMVLGLCKKLKLPVQVSMGGGYSPKVSDIVDAHCNTFRVAHDLYF